MSTLSRCLWASAAAAVCTAGVLLHLSRRQAGELGWLRDQKGAWQLKASRMLEQRHQARPGPGPVAASRPGNAGGSLQEAPSRAEAPVLHSREYHDEGCATPLAALQTFAWAGDRGDVEGVQAMLSLDPPARRRLETYLAGLPEASRREWSSVEQMSAALLCSAAIQNPFPGSAVLSQAQVEPEGEGRVQLRLPHTPRDRSVFALREGLWRYVVTEAMVESYLRHLAGGD